MNDLTNGWTKELDRLRAENAAQAAEIERLTRERNEWKAACEGHGDKASVAEAKVAELTEALEPFSRLEIPKRPQGNAGAYSIRHSDIERARAALGAKP